MGAGLRPGAKVLDTPPDPTAYAPYFYLDRTWRRWDRSLEGMSRRGKTTRLLERRFKIKVPLERAWAHLEKVEQWPTWARHIRRVDLHPWGPLKLESKGTIRLTNGVRSTFRMEELNPGTNWKWAGPFLWLIVHYDHRFTRTGPDETEIEFVLDGEGFGACLLGRLFAAIYSQNLNRAIPNLIQELERE